MCTAAAKYFKGIGWVLAKNRDQDYVSNTSFIDELDKNVGEILLMKDKEIDYKEGMNHKGLAIITTSLAPLISLETNKKDGDAIFKALHMTTPERAAQYLIKQKITGYIFVCTPEKLILIEAARDDQGKGEYHSDMKIISKSETIVRTNHGIEFPWAGFQTGVDEKQDVWRKSSEMRKQIAEKTLKQANSPEEMLEALAKKVASDLQLNVFRVENKPRQMRTIFQWALVPSQSEAIIRPIQSKMNLKVTHEKISVRVLDNKPIKKLYDGRIRHFTKLEVSQNEKEIKAIQTEALNFSKLKTLLSQ
jgi:hypothetical protein